MRQRLARIPEFTGDTSTAALTQNVSHLKDIPVSRFSWTEARVVGNKLITEFGNQDPAVRQAVIHAFTRSIDTVWIVMTPLCGVCLVLGTPQTLIASLDAGTDPSYLCVSIVLFIRHYSMKRTIVQEGRKNGEGGTPSGAVTPATQVAGRDPLDTPQTIEEERKRPVSDIEKGLNESEDGSEDVKDERR